jgi:hypothetical protein
VSAPTPQDARHELLEPYVQRLRAFLRARGDEDRPLTIPSEPIPLELSAEERRAAWSVLCDETVAWSEAGAWIPLGAGLHLAVAEALQSATRAGSGDASEELGEMRAVASAYTEALREAIADVVTGGQTDEAKRLSSFRNKLFPILTALRAGGVRSAPPAPEARLDAPSSDPSPTEAPDVVASIDSAPASDLALDPYLQRAAAFFRARGNEERPLTIAFGRRTLSLSAWQRRVVWQSLCEGQEPASDWHLMIPKCVAVQLALLPALEELERAGRSPGVQSAARSTLHALVTLAAGVVEAFRAQIERAVGAGALEDAKQLSALSNVFQTTLIEARRALAEGENGATVDGHSGQGGTAASPDQPATGAAPAGPPDKLEPFLDRAANLLELRGHDDRPLSIPVGGRSWNLDGWERQVLWKALCEEGPKPPEWLTLLARGAAAQLAALLALERLSRTDTPTDSPADAEAEADRDTALELASDVVERMRAAAETLEADGQAKLAVRLNRFRVKVTEASHLLRQAR